jgi:hypothetical protein
MRPIWSACGWRELFEATQSATLITPAASAVSPRTEAGRLLLAAELRARAPLGKFVQHRFPPRNLQLQPPRPTPINRPSGARDRGSVAKRKQGPLAKQLGPKPACPHNRTRPLFPARPDASCSTPPNRTRSLSPRPTGRVRFDPAQPEAFSFPPPNQKRPLPRPRATGSVLFDPAQPEACSSTPPDQTRPLRPRPTRRARFDRSPTPQPERAGPNTRAPPSPTRRTAPG